MSEENKEVYCIFCNRTSNDAFLVVDGKGRLGVCSYCVDACYKILNNRNELNEAVCTTLLEKMVERPLMKPAEIKAHLDQYVIGQEHVKKHLQLQFTIIISGYRD